MTGGLNRDHEELSKTVIFKHDQFDLVNKEFSTDLVSIHIDNPMLSLHRQVFSIPREIDKKLAVFVFLCLLTNDSICYFSPVKQVKMADEISRHMVLFWVFVKLCLTSIYPYFFQQTWFQTHWFVVYKSSRGSNFHGYHLPVCFALPPWVYCFMLLAVTRRTSVIRPRDLYALCQNQWRCK